MNAFLWFASGLIAGWLLKAAQVEWRMQMLTQYVLQSVMEMREQWSPLEKVRKDWERKYSEPNKFGNEP